MARLLGYRQAEGAATDKPDLALLRYISTLPNRYTGAEREDC